MALNDPNNPSQGLQNNTDQNTLGGMNPSMPMDQYNARQQQQRGTGFTNIGKILGANQGAGEKIGQKIGSGINDQANAVRQGIQQGQSSFQAGKNESFNQAQGAVDVGAQMARHAGENDIDYSNRVSQQQGDLTNQGQAFQNAAYSGPQGLTNEGLLQSKASTASALARLGGNASGQNQLLRNLVANRGQYTQGQAGLDQLLLGQGGQKYVQDARQNAAGLEQQAGGAITSAQQEAANAKSAIDTNKVNALQSLRNSLTGAGDDTSGNISGLQTIAQKQGQDFNTNASQLSRILQGVDENGQPLTKLSDSDRNLLEHAQDYGLDTSASLYEKDPNAVKNAINNLAQTSLNQGGMRYLGNEQQAAGNLATFLGDKQLQNQITNNKFDANAFKTSAKDAFGQLGSQKAYDTESKDILTRAGNQIAGMEQTSKQSNEDARQKALAQNANNPQALNMINQYYDRANNTLLNKTNPSIQDMSNFNQQYGLKGFSGDAMDPAMQKIYETLGAQTAIQGTQETNDPFAKYGFLNYADRGEADIDPRFKGLGLGVQNVNGSGQYRSSSSLLDAANKTLSPEESLKQYLLKKYGNS